jgi:hypothetical protein
LAIGVHGTHVSALVATATRLNREGSKLLSTGLESTLALHRAAVRCASYLVNTDTALWKGGAGLGNDAAAVVGTELSPGVTDRNIVQRLGDETAFIGTVVAVPSLKRQAVLIRKAESGTVFLLVVAACETTVCSSAVVRFHVASASSNARVANVGADAADWAVRLDC